MNIPNEILEKWNDLLEIIHEEEIYKAGFDEGCDAVCDGVEYDNSPFYDDVESPFYDGVELRYNVRN